MLSGVSTETPWGEDHCVFCTPAEHHGSKKMDNSTGSRKRGEPLPPAPCTKLSVMLADKGEMLMGSSSSVTSEAAKGSAEQ